MSNDNSGNSVFEQIALALDRAVLEKSVSIVQAEAENCGLAEVPTLQSQQSHRWEHVDGMMVIALEWRWYDQSKSFSIRPDMNIMVLSLAKGDEVIRRIEKRFED